MDKEKVVQVEKNQLAHFAKELLLSLPVTEYATVVALSGDLGAGKTALVKALALELGVLEEVTSPTFTILKGYETTDSTWRQLLHMDAYRIENLDELRPLYFNELLGQTETIFCIEWAENIEEALPDGCTWLHISNTENEEIRTIRITGAAVNSN